MRTNSLLLVILFSLFSFTVNGVELPPIKTAEVNGTSIEYIDVGEGEPIVFVHGAISDLRAWGDYIEPISENHRFVAYTRRFYGDKEWPENPVYDFEEHADDLVALIQFLDSGPVHLVGWSSSGNIVTFVAAKHPELVMSTVQYEPVVDKELMDGFEPADAWKSVDDDWGSRWGVVFQQLDQGDSRHALRKFVELVFEKPPGGFESMPSSQQEVFLTNGRTFPLYFDHKTKTKITCDYVGAIDVPTTIINGGETGKWFSMQAERMAECMPNAKLIIVPGVHHDGPIAKPGAVIDAVLGMVKANPSK